MTAQVVSPKEFYGRWLMAELRRVNKKLEAHPLRDCFHALDVLLDCGIDPRDRRAVKRILGGIVPNEFRGNRKAYEAFIDWCVKEHTEVWALHGWLDDKVYG
jgi:hypothetical protein